MQHYGVQQEQRTCVLQEDMQQFIQEISTLRSLAEYVAQTFERFRQATAFHQQVEFSTLAAALQYLRASLHVSYFLVSQFIVLFT
jgi:hypothetical protein